MTPAREVSDGLWQEWCVTFPQVGAVASFAWHPSLENTLLAVGWKGFSEWTVSDRLTLNWSG